MQSTASGYVDPAKAPADPPKRARFGEPLKFTPVVYAGSTILFLFASYIQNHCLPLLQLTVDPKNVDESMRQRGVIEMCLFLYFTTLLTICYIRSVLVHPGEIPDNDPQWSTTAFDKPMPVDWAPMALQEMKKTGERRHCKWCGKYKPDRCHHCRVCKCCILKMDHHCPWIYNCVGFANYKFFFLLLFYAVLDTHLVTWSMLESVKRCIDTPDSVSFNTMFMTFFSEMLSFFLMVLVTLFFLFHVMLSCKAMTTIEYCEKYEKSVRFETSVYDLGLFGNLRAILGNNLLLWAFPCSRPPGDGLNFISDETRLTKDLECAKGVRRKTHQRTQRVARPLDDDGSRRPQQSFFSPVSYGTTNMPPKFTG